MTIPARRYIIAAAFTLVLAGFSIWLLPFGWAQRHIYYKDYTFSEEEARRLRHYPAAMAAHGRQAWVGLDAEGAAHAYREVVIRDVADMGAWLELAEAEAAAGRLDQARAVVVFVARHTQAVMFWQWPTALLAHDLELEDIFRGAVNRLAAHGWKLADTFNLADTHFAGDARAVLAALAPEARPAYLEWLMRWGRLEDARLAWRQITVDGTPDPPLRLKYEDFLISRKEVAAAAALRGSSPGGMTNGGFELAVTQKGFDWRWGRDPEGRWGVQQAFGQGRDNGTAVRVAFYGEANLAFHHLYQIVPVKPGVPHRLRWWWRSQTLTTDQGPLLEVYGYDCRGFRAQGPMLTGSHDWHPASLDFTPPADCQAVMVRLRRHQSHRFDSKIAGTVWLDDFEIIGAFGAS